ncbi:hypothetical protein [Paraburkholderia unamae]|nr:hypothetical protein [Paraburkholderia unamae]
MKKIDRPDTGLALATTSTRRSGHGAQSERRNPVIMRIALLWH